MVLPDEVVGILLKDRIYVNDLSLGQALDYVTNNYSNKKFAVIVQLRIPCGMDSGIAYMPVGKLARIVKLNIACRNKHNRKSLLKPLRDVKISKYLDNYILFNPK